LYNNYKKKINQISLPSNKKFGFFFSFIFFILALYFFLEIKLTYSYFFAALCIFFILISFFKSNILLPLNKLWMRFGLLLSLIISPIILGIIYFIIFTPIGIFMKLFGRDELFLKNKKKNYILV